MPSVFIELKNKVPRKSMSLRDILSHSYLLKKSQAKNISTDLMLVNSLFAISNNSFTVDKIIPSNRDNDINNIVITILYPFLKFYNIKSSYYAQFHYPSISRFNLFPIYSAYLSA